VVLTKGSGILYAIKENEDLLKQIAPALFDRTMKNDMLDAMVLDIGRLLDPASQNKNVNASLEKLINEVQSIEPELAKQLKEHRDTLIRDLPNFDIWRDKWAAHRDYDVMLKMRTQSRDRPRFSRDHIVCALAGLDSFLNAFERVFGNKPIINPTAASDIEDLIPAPTQYTDFDATDEIEHFLNIIRAGIRTWTLVSGPVRHNGPQFLVDSALAPSGITDSGSVILSTGRRAAWKN
jgi:hypothetical protein